MRLPLRPADLVAARTPGQLDVRGGAVVYTLRSADARGERTELWTVDVGTGHDRRLTTGPGRDTTPRISPDGRTAVFLRSAGDAPAQAHLVDLADGTTRTLTTFARGVQDLAWYPDGTALVVLAEDDESPLVVDGPDGAAPTAVVLRRLDWRADGDGDAGLRLHPRHLHRVPLHGDAVRLTAGPWSAARPRVAGDGSVHLIADPGRDADLDPYPQVWKLTADGGMEPVTALAGGVVRYHLQGDELRVLGRDGTPERDCVPAIWTDADGTPLSPKEVWTGLLGDETDLFDWSVEADDAPGLTTLSRDGRTVPVDLARNAELVEGPVVCGALAEDGGTRVAVLATGRGAVAPDVVVLEPAGPRRLTRHGDWLAAFEPPRAETIEVDGPGGPITVRLLHPAGASVPGAAVLAVHGGPTGQFADAAPLDALLLASSGYLVAMPNIRGSIDRGPEWVEPLSGRWGDVDAADCHAVCDGLVARGLADPSRLGVTGLSYGGFLTQWLIATSDRFAAAVAENGVSNQVAAWAGCAEGVRYNAAGGLGDPLTPEGAQRLWDCSPLAHVAGIRTPLLMLQAADDRTCPASDNEQLFVALRALRRDVEYVLYPGESHLMQGTGRLDRRIDRHERMLAWFARHLPASHS